MRRALISVSDKTGIVDFAKKLLQENFEIISTGGTFKLLKENNIEVREVSDITGFPECLDGRVKTLHPFVHAGLLAIRDNKEHMETLEEFAIKPIDLLVVNLYPFKETILKENSTFENAIENIDIGGPSMLRGAAKNYKYVTVLTDPEDYNNIIAELKKDGNISLATNLDLATKVFAYTAHYDSLIATYLSEKSGKRIFGDTLTLTYEKKQTMRYGENPHQKAIFYSEIKSGNKNTLTDAIQLHGKELSFNNINDASAAIEILKDFNEEPTVVACKHSNPCAIASGKDIYEAYTKAYNADKQSIYGGIVALNREVDEKTAEEINKIFLELVIAPSFSAKALEILKSKKNIRLLEIENISEKAKKSIDLKKVSGGILLQETDELLFDKLEKVTKKSPENKELKDLKFAFKVVKWVKSNGIAIVKNKQTLGLGLGQVSRIWACNQAIDHSIENFGKEHLKGAVLASDAFFPFDDCVESAYKAGISSIIQPGGSINDKLSIEACDKFGISMLFTGIRHFRH